MIKVQRRPALHSWLGSRRPAPCYVMRANRDSLSCPLLTQLTLANIPSSSAGPAAGNPGESPAARRLALPTLLSLGNNAVKLTLWGFHSHNEETFTQIHLRVLSQRTLKFNTFCQKTEHVSSQIFFPQWAEITQSAPTL